MVSGCRSPRPTKEERIPYLFSTNSPTALTITRPLWKTGLMYLRVSFSPDSSHLLPLHMVAEKISSTSPCPVSTTTGPPPLSSPVPLPPAGSLEFPSSRRTTRDRGADMGELRHWRAEGGCTRDVAAFVSQHRCRCDPGRASWRSIWLEDGVVQD